MSCPSHSSIQPHCIGYPSSTVLHDSTFIECTLRHLAQLEPHKVECRERVVLGVVRACVLNELSQMLLGEDAQAQTPWRTHRVGKELDLPVSLQILLYMGMCVLTTDVSTRLSMGCTRRSAFKSFSMPGKKAVRSLYIVFKKHNLPCPKRIV